MGYDRTDYVAIGERSSSGFGKVWAISSRAASCVREPDRLDARLPFRWP
jgi:hypothetical protein